MINEEKQLLLRQYVVRMSKVTMPDEEIQDILAEMKQKVYNDQEFRHRYSDFFKWIVDMVQDDPMFDLSAIGENIQRLYAFAFQAYQTAMQQKLTAAQKKREQQSFANIEKFCDHLNLTLAEYEYNKRNQDEIGHYQTDFRALQSTLRDMKSDLEKADRDLSKNKKKLKSMQMEFVTILSIFAAIVIATAGGFSYITAAMASLDNGVPLHRTICVISIAGFFLFNSVFVLLYIIGKITERSIYSSCPSFTPIEEEKNCKAVQCSSCKIKCSGYFRIMYRLPYVFWFNIVVCIIWIVVLIRWLYLNSYITF